MPKAAAALTRPATAVAPVRVQAADSGSPAVPLQTGSLPVTGSDPGLLLTLGLLAVGVGRTLLGTGRRLGRARA